MRTAIAILVLLATVYSAHAFGMGKLGFIFGREGLPSKGGNPPAPPGCSGTGLNFTIACNSQYIGIL